MIFHPTRLGGVFLVEMEPARDERGYFARTFDEREFMASGLCADVAQCSVSFNQRKGTVRGMHLQLAPQAEKKLIRCTRGAAWDVIVDLRSESTTFCQWVGAELTADNMRMMYVPEGCAHGFQTLADGTELVYQISTDYSPQHSTGVRWNDPRFAIEWPLAVSVISERDAGWPDYTG